MGFTDWIKNRNASQQASVAENSQQQKPETAKEMYSREAAQEKANAKPITPEIKAQADRVTATMDKATQHMSQNSGAPSAAPSDGASSPQPMRQNMTGQDKTAPALSPTSAQRGQTEKDSPGKSNAPAETQTKAADRAQTLPRPKPSWER
jgi:hypothetical protein